MKILYIFIALVFLFITASPAQAAEAPNCQAIYGGGPSCEQTPPLTINKQVQNPDNKSYVDSLAPTDPQYNGGQKVLFKITITNDGAGVLNFLTVTDFFPEFIDYSKGSGKYDAKKRSLEFTIDQLKSKESKVFFVEGKVVPNEKLSESQQARCVINQARVADNDKSSQDNTLICLGKSNIASTATPVPTNTPKSPAKPTVKPASKPVTKGGLPIYPPAQTKSTPDTGPEAWALIGLIPMSGLGFLLRNKAKT